MRNVNFHTCLKVDNKIWFISVEGYLMNFDIVTNESEIIIPNNLLGVCFKQVIDNMIYDDNKIYFVEQDGSKLFEYNQITNYCASYLIPDTKCINWECFSGIYLFGRIIYLFTKVSGVIHCFDIDSKRFTSINEEKNDIVLNSFRIQDRVYLYGKKVICFDMSRHFFVGEYDFQEGDILWMNSYQNNILFLTKKQVGIWNQYDKLKTSLYEEENVSQKFLISLSTENKIFVLPNHSKDILIIDKRTGKASYAILPDDLYYIENGWSKYWGYTEDDRFIWCANRVSNYVFSVDKKNEEIRWLKVKTPDLKSEIQYLKLMEKKFFYESEMDFEIILLIDRIVLQHDEDSNGQKIWRYLS